MSEPDHTDESKPASFHGRDHVFDRRPDLITISAADWRTFADACRTACLQPTFENWIAWRTTAGPFARRL